jgi:AAA+ lid domain
MHIIIKESYMHQVHSRGKALAKDVDFEKIARRTPGFTGADLQNLMNEAAILAARRELKEISKDEISDALERIIAGPEKKNAVVSEEKKKLVAYHGSKIILTNNALLLCFMRITQAFYQICGELLIFLTKTQLRICKHINCCINSI